VTWLIATSPAPFAEIAYLPGIEGGLGPVAVGELLAEPEGAKDRRFAVCHHWPIDGPDVAWAEIYGAPDIAVAADLPADWRHPAPGA
jgi:hypothetical protein